MKPNQWQKYLERGQKYLDYLASLETTEKEWKDHYASLGMEV